MSAGIGGYWRDRRAEARLLRLSRRPIVWVRWKGVRVEERWSVARGEWRWWVWVGRHCAVGGSLREAVRGLRWARRLTRYEDRRARKSIERWTGRRR